MIYLSFLAPGLLLLAASAPSRSPSRASEPPQEASRAAFVLSHEVECLRDLYRRSSDEGQGKPIIGQHFTESSFALELKESPLLEEASPPGSVRRVLVKADQSYRGYTANLADPQMPWEGHPDWLGGVFDLEEGALLWVDVHIKPALAISDDGVRFLARPFPKEVERGLPFLSESLIGMEALAGLPTHTRAHLPPLLERAFWEAIEWDLSARETPADEELELRFKGELDATLEHSDEPPALEFMGIPLGVTETLAGDVQGVATWTRRAAAAESRASDWMLVIEVDYKLEWSAAVRTRGMDLFDYDRTVVGNIRYEAR